MGGDHRRITIAMLRDQKILTEQERKMATTYKMVQIPPNVTVSMKNAKGNEAAAYLEKTVTDMTQQGWDFYRVDAIGVEQTPGCLGALLGQKAISSLYYVITFRRTT